MNAKQLATNKSAFGLAGQVAVVTGASSGIGRACALALGYVGAKVVVNHLPESSDEAVEVCREIEGVGGAAFAYAADVSNEKQVATMFADTVARFGNRIGEPADIAHTVLWLASHLSDYMTGTTRIVDGGMSAYPTFRGAG